VTGALKLVKPYTGPSKIWFRYQEDLDEACAILAEEISKLPASSSSAKLLVSLLLRLERKMSNGVDDSNGAVGELMMQTVDLLLEFSRANPERVKEFAKLRSLRTSFGWEEALVAKLKKPLITVFGRNNAKTDFIHLPNILHTSPKNNV
jgi:hypothetical protein